MAQVTGLWILIQESLPFWAAWCPFHASKKGCCSAENSADGKYQVHSMKVTSQMSHIKPDSPFTVLFFFLKTSLAKIASCRVSVCPILLYVIGLLHVHWKNRGHIHLMLPHPLYFWFRTFNFTRSSRLLLEGEH